MSSIVSLLRAARIRRGIAAAAVVLATGGLVLFRTPTDAGAGMGGLLTAPNSATLVHFAGPGAHGSLGLSHGMVLSGGERDVYAEVRLQADKDGRDEERAPLALAVVLDTSGSMYGDKIDQARQSVLDLIRDMRDDDQIAVVRYSDDAEVLQPLARVGDVRSELNARIRRLVAEGGTAIPRGLSSGLRALEDATRGRVKRVVLISDGLDSSRLEAERLAQVSFGKGVTISALGIGLDFDESYMSSVARAGHGHYGFVKDGGALAAFLAKELGEAASTTVEDATVKVHIPHGMHFIGATGADARVLDEDEIELKLGALYAGDERRAILHFSVRLEAGETASLDGTAGWTRVHGGTDTRVQIDALTLAGTRDARAVDDNRDTTVIASWTSVRASERNMEAAEAYQSGDVDKAQKLIDQNMADLSAVAATAPAPVATALRQQQRSYADTKQGFGASPSSAAGKAAAKHSVELDSENLGRAGSF